MYAFSSSRLLTNSSSRSVMPGSDRCLRRAMDSLLRHCYNPTHPRLTFVGTAASQQDQPCYIAIMDEHPNKLVAGLHRAAQRPSTHCSLWHPRQWHSGARENTNSAERQSDLQGLSAWESNCGMYVNAMM